MQPKAVPTAPEALQQSAMARVLRLGTVLLAATTLAYAIGYLVAERWLMVAIETAACVGTLGVYWLARRHQNNQAGLTGQAWLMWITAGSAAPREKCRNPSSLGSKASTPWSLPTQIMPERSLNNA